MACAERPCGRRHRYEARKESERLLAEVAKEQMELAYCTKLVDKRKPRPLAMYSSSELLRILLINNLVLIVFGFL